MANNIDSSVPECATHRKCSLAQDDIVKYRRAFDSADRERRGKVRSGDLEDVVQKLGYRLTPVQMQDILLNHDLNDESLITFEQFLEIIPRNSKEISENDHSYADLREKFQRYDTDKNGVISLNEAQCALQQELQVTPVTALRLLNQFVKLDYEQFVGFYKQVQDTKMAIYQKFAKYDRNKDGMISIDEAHDVLHKELGFNKNKSLAAIERFDLNKDGQVSYIEFAEFYIAVEERKARIRETFRKFDPNDVGFVSNEDAQLILGSLMGFSYERCRKTIELYDKNGDGKIDYEEFLEFYSMMEEEREHILSEFQRYDTDGDGRISFDELEQMLKKQGYSDKDIQATMAGYDTNQDGLLDFNEFKKFLNMSPR